MSGGGDKFLRGHYSLPHRYSKLQLSMSFWILPFLTYNIVPLLGSNSTNKNLNTFEHFPLITGLQGIVSGQRSDNNSILSIVIVNAMNTQMKNMAQQQTLYQS